MGTVPQGYADVVAVLLERGAPLEVADNAGWRPLHLACVQGNIDVAALLLARGARLDAPFPVRGVQSRICLGRGNARTIVVRRSCLSATNGFTGLQYLSLSGVSILVLPIMLLSLFVMPGRRRLTHARAYHHSASQLVAHAI